MVSLYKGIEKEENIHLVFTTENTGKIIIMNDGVEEYLCTKKFP